MTNQMTPQQVVEALERVREALQISYPQEKVVNALLELPAAISAVKGIVGRENKLYEGAMDEIAYIVSEARDNSEGLRDWLMMNYPKEWGLTKEEHERILSGPAVPVEQQTVSLLERLDRRAKLAESEDERVHDDFQAGLAAGLRESIAEFRQHFSSPIWGDATESRRGSGV